MARQLTEFEAKEARQMLEDKVSISRIAKRFGTNKPAVLKALNLWDSKPQGFDGSGTMIKVVRGKAIVYNPEFEKKVEVEAE